MPLVRVTLPGRTYSVRIEEGALAQTGRHCDSLRLGKSCAIISDQHVAPLYGSAVEKSLRDSGFRTAAITVPAGEQAKRLAMAGRCYDQLAEARMDRHSFIVALGGGVVGDLAGFVAATYLRGIDLVQVPTTLLAQVDSAVGGKVGINLPAGKNLVGAFLQPRLVLADPVVLKTLPLREFRSGLAEVIKYGIIYDPKLFRRLGREMPRLLERDFSCLGPVIARCCEIKAEIVGQDETEGGIRAILNFGHTVGHALEASAGYGTMLHGEAIAIGQAVEARLSEEVLSFPSSETRRINELLQKAGLPVRYRLTAPKLGRVLKAMQLDKKNRDGQIRFVLAQEIGRVKYGCAVPAELVRRVLEAQAGTLH